MTKTTIKTLPLSALAHDEEANARKAGTDLAELKASILAHGVVQSLRVRASDDKGTFLVVAGNRRLAALRELADEDLIAGDFAVPVIVGKEDVSAAREISLVENVERVALTPVDEFRAFKALSDDGATAGDIASRFGLPERRVLQRLRLAALHDDVIAALDAGAITLEAAQAFTVQPDPERQRQYLEANADKSWMLQAGNVRRAMADEHLRATAPLARLIGEEAYKAAGGVVREDLFGEDRFWISTAVIEQLTAAKWADQVEAWKADGWAWAAPYGEYGEDAYRLRRLYAERQEPSEDDQARLDAIDAELEGLYETPESDDEAAEAAVQSKIDTLEAERNTINERYQERAFTAEQKAVSGVVYSEDGDRILFGVLDPDKADVPEEAAPVKAKPKKDAADPEAISAALSQDLSLMLGKSLRRKIEADPELALSLLAATIFRSLAHGRVPSKLTALQANGLAIKFEDEGFDVAVERYRALTPKARAKALASLFAATVDVSDNFTAYSGDRDARAALIAAVEPDPTPDFNAERYFEGVSKAVIVAAYREMTGGGMNDDKKAKMASFAAAKATETGWLPVQLRTAAYAGPAGKAKGKAVKNAA